MPAYSFKERFVPLIKAGTKTQTIRAISKKKIKPGDTVYLYYGMRTKHCTKIGEGICTKVSEIIIMVTGVFIDGKLIHKAREFNKLARADGFYDWKEMWEYFRGMHNLPFKGNIIYWSNTN